MNHGYPWLPYEPVLRESSLRRHSGIFISILTAQEDVTRLAGCTFPESKYPLLANGKTRQTVVI